MSKIGRNPIEILEGVEVKIDGNLVSVKGPQGELTHSVNKEVKVKIEEGKVVLKIQKEVPGVIALWGLNRALIANMIKGVKEGFTKKLQIVGVGFKAQKQGKKLILNLGFSHPVEYLLSEGIDCEIEKDIITIKGFDKQLVGETAAEIRKFREPEPYKGKGIRYLDEHVRRKVGKSAIGSGE
jgi:large subunit ribosomal protein L6